MKSRMSSLILLACVVFASAVSFARVTVDSKGCTPGRYTSDKNAALAYAKEKNRFVVVVWGKNDGSCAICETASLGYGGDGFLSWSESNGIPLLYVTAASGDWVTKMINETAFPQMVVLDRNGAYVGHFRCATQAVKNFGSGAGSITFTATSPSFQKGVDALIDLIDNSAPHSITPTEKMEKFGLYYGYGVNSVGRKDIFDASDSYVIAKDTPADKDLLLTFEKVSDASDSGRVSVTAKDGTVLVQDMPLKDVVEQDGIRIKGSMAKTGLRIRVYLVSGKTARVNYSLATQLVEATPDVSFAITETGPLETSETGADLTFHVTKSSDDPSDKDGVSFVIESVTNAVQGVDYVLKDGSSVLSANVIAFPAGVTSKAITVKPLSDGGIWKGDRSFTLRLSVSSGDANKQVSVRIKESDGEYDAADLTDGAFVADKADNVKAGATQLTLSKSSPMTAECGAQLNSRDVADWYAFTPEADAMVIVTLKPTVLTNGVNSLTLKVEGGDAVTCAAGETKTIRFSPAAADPVAFSVSRPANAAACARYDVSVSVDTGWEKPAIGFKEGTLEVPDTATVGQVVFTRTGSQAAADRIRVTVKTAKGQPVATGDFSVTNDVVTFGTGAKATEAVLDILPNVADNSGVWKGDRAFKVTFELLDKEFCQLGETTELALTLKGMEPEYEEGDSAGESASAPGFSKALSGGPKAVRTMHGGDAVDYFAFTGAEKDKIYQFAAAVSNLVLRNVAASDVKATVSVPGRGDTNLVFGALAGLRLKALADGDIRVKLSREVTSMAEKPVSFRYELGVAEWFPPQFSFSSNKASVLDTNEVIEVTVTRSVNLTGKYTIWLKAENTSAGVRPIYFGAAGSATAEIPVTFADNESSKVVPLEFIGDVYPGLYTSNRLARVWLDTKGAEETKLETPSEMTVTFIDVDAGENGLGYDKYDPEDDVFDGRTAVGTLAKLPKSKALTTDVLRLNGNDTTDWSAVRGATAGDKVCIGADLFDAVDSDLTWANVSPEDVTVTIYKTSSINPGTKIKIGDSTTLADLRAEEWKWDCDAACDLAVEVSRAPSAGGAVSAQYQLKFRIQPPREVTFVCDAADVISVDETKGAVFFDLNLALEGGAGDELAEPLSVEVVPSELEDDDQWSWVIPADWRARSGEDFDSAPVTVTWPAGSKGGVMRAYVNLTNHDALWEGDEYFKIRLASDGADSPGERLVKIVDKESRTFGTVGLTGLATSQPPQGMTLETPLATRTYDVREGEDLRLELTRAGGQAGMAVGVFTWKEGRTTVSVATNLLWTGLSAREDVVTNVFVKVPESEGFQLSRALTVEFVPYEVVNGVDAGSDLLVWLTRSGTLKKATVTKGTPSTLKFNVTDRSYAGTLSQYGEGSRSNLTFVAAAGNWYLTSRGSVAAVSPDKGKVSSMSAEVTGPAILHVRATVTPPASGCTAYAQVSGIRTAFADGANAYDIEIPAGRRNVVFALERPRNAPEASLEVEILGLERQEAFYKIGTFTGPVNVEDVSDDGAARWIPGLGTMTVSSAGKVSGKIQCADRTWTFQSDTAWDAAGNLSVVARNATFVLSFGLRLVVDAGAGCSYVALGSFESGEIYGMLSRVPWEDRPLSALAATAMDDGLEPACQGYYTMALRGGESDIDLYGSGYLTFTVSDAGQVKAVGYLADGQAVNFASTLLFAENGRPLVQFYTSPSVYRKQGWYSQSVALSAPTNTPGEAPVYTAEQLKHRVIGTGNADAPAIPTWERRGLFSRTTIAEGGQYDTTENLAAYYAGLDLGIRRNTSLKDSEITIAGQQAKAETWAADGEHPVELDFNADGSKIIATVLADDAATFANPFSVTFSRVTGVLGGNFRVQYGYGEGGGRRVVTKTAEYRGVLIPWREYRPGAVEALGRIEGYGFFLIDGVSHGVEIQGTPAE